jgi:hypothetical protein
VTSCVDAAGPIDHDSGSVVVTNWDANEERTIRVDQLPKRFFAQCSLLNDLEATCYGILGLNRAGRLSEFFDPLWGSEPHFGPQSCTIHFLIFPISFVSLL